MPVFRATNGRIGSKWRIGAGWKKPVPTLLLDHVGRKSGTQFTTPLLYLADGPRLVIVASQGGLPKNPQWFHNLVANPDTAVALRGERRREVRARVADSEERAALWPRLVELYADFDNYQATAEIGVDVTIAKNIGIRAYLQDVFNNNPAPGRGKNDLKLVTALSYKF